MEELHECKSLRNIEVPIAIEKHNNHWLWVFYDDKKGTTAHGIKYCPYCGELLNK